MRHPVIDDDSSDCFVMGFASTVTGAIRVANVWMEWDNPRAVGATLVVAPNPSGNPDVQTAEDVRALESGDAWLVEWEANQK